VQRLRVGKVKISNEDSYSVEQSENYAPVVIGSEEHNNNGLLYLLLVLLMVVNTCHVILLYSSVQVVRLHLCFGAELRRKSSQFFKSLPPI